jgi:AAA15 family ATPase/GTPase
MFEFKNYFCVKLVNMIGQLNISNYKSIEGMQLNCKKINVFIGEPNSGKSNIIEALALLSQGVVDSNRLSKEIFRYKNMGDLFFDFNINEPIDVDTGITKLALFYNVPNSHFHFSVSKPDAANLEPLKLGHDGTVLHGGTLFDTPFRYYEYKRPTGFVINYAPHLAVPYGDNLPSLLLSNPEYRKWVSEFFQEKGFKLTLKPTENDINMSKLVGDEIYSYLYPAISETMQRVIFYMLAVKSNQDAVLLMDEPESNTFPFYTKYIAERIALDETNQFFLTTHNPYLLLNLIEKSPPDRINVCIVKMNNYRTVVTSLNEKQITELLDFNSDVFLNLETVLA